MLFLGAAVKLTRKGVRMSMDIVFRTIFSYHSPYHMRVHWNCIG